MPVTSTTSSVKRWPKAEAVLGALESWGAAAAEGRDDLLALGYFGSYARGDAGFGSDLDLILIVASDPRPPMERAIDWRTDALPVPTDLLVYTLAEWRRLQAVGARFARTLHAETKWLWNRTLEQHAASAGTGSRRPEQT